MALRGCSFGRAHGESDYFGCSSEDNSAQSIKNDKIVILKSAKSASIMRKMSAFELIMLK